MLDYRNFTIKKCTEENLEQILELQDEVVNTLDSREYLRINDKKMFLKCLRDPNVTLGVFDKDTLVAIAILFDGMGTEEDLSLGLKEYTVEKSINFKLVMVKPNYRGNRFQISLISCLEKIAYSRGYTDICTTVSKDNVYSYDNVLEKGFVKDHNDVKYGGMSREVLCKNIKKTMSDYIQNIFDTVSSIEGKKSKSSLVLEGINLSRCFKGSIDMAYTGDVVEYYDTDTGENIYGLVLRKFFPFVCIYIPSVGELKVVEFSEKIDSMVLKNILINTLGC